MIAAAANTSSFLRQPLTISLGLHGFALLVFGLLAFKPNFSLPRRVEVEVLEFPKLAPTSMQLNQPPREQVKPKAEEPKRAVFGVSRNAMTAPESATDAVQVKQGNTVAKTQDDLKLDKADADQLPIPTDDFLVSSMPRLNAEVRIPYPELAKKSGIEGPVVMDLLIDALGIVRQVTLIKGPGYGLNEAAIAAAQQFKFTPGRVADKAVAVRIRYTYRFVLENR